MGTERTHATGLPCRRNGFAAVGSSNRTAAAVSGLALFAAAHIAWEVQLRVGRRCLPPADFMLLALPAILFGASILAVACYGSVAALLAFAGFVGVRSGFRGNPEALAGAAHDLHAGSGTPVALVGLASPPLLGALALQAVLRGFGIEA